MNGQTFVKITNNMIYKEIKELNGKVSKNYTTLKWHTWAIGVILMVTLAVISGRI